MMVRALILAFTLLWLSPIAAKEGGTLPRIAANSSAKLKAQIGKTVTVVGKVNNASVSRSGHHFLNFTSSDVTVICFKDHVGKFKKGGPAKQFSSKQVAVTGKLELYRGKPQIKLTDPSQIQLAGSKDTTPSLADVKVGGKRPSLDDVKVGGGKAKFELKQIGKFTWISPAGLKYAGKDPQGRTRVEHVLRHAADEPRRAGSHGVFDGGNDQALATVDEAWKLVKKKKIKPKNEGRTSAYTIPMGRRVGYLGGQTGARRKKPALSKVFIVVRTGTSEVITAFPR